jgi:hypothetical protein
MGNKVTLVSDAASAPPEMRKQQAALYERDALPYPYLGKMYPAALRLTANAPTPKTWSRRRSPRHAPRSGNSSPAPT